ncbi:MAG: TniQ family protein [Acidobacteria bacterium]|nr:TniQ family protein [Acidobacteriota bacterium]
MSLEDLLQVTKDTVTLDEIFAMIAPDVLYVDWHAAPLAEPKRVGVFPTSEPNIFHGRFYAMNGLGEPARKWVDALQAGTMQTDLRFLTLLSFADLFWPLAVFRRRRAWCGECFENDRANGEHVYERLIWALRAATVCPQHKTGAARSLSELLPEVQADYVLFPTGVLLPMPVMAWWLQFRGRSPSSQRLRDLVRE